MERHAARLSCALTAVVAAGLFMAAPADAQTALIIDHTCTDLDRVPAYWIDAAKQLTIHYGHTSHGSQVNSGAELLEQIDSFYSFARRASNTEGLPPVEDPPALRMYDGNPPETYITPEDYWSTEDGRDRTRAVADTGNYNYSMWSWCGQVSSASESYITTYLTVMSGFEAEYTAMRFILMTGHTDGSGVDGTLNTRNNQIRNYATANGMILFDFADIESWDPDGTWYLPLGCNDYGSYDGGDWPAEWCAANPDSDLCQSCSCAHSQSLICNLKGRAFWWMMARLAGWGGIVHADCNCDTNINFDDIDAFVSALTNRTDYETAYPMCSWYNADCNNDGTVNFNDIDVFVDTLVGGE